MVNGTTTYFICDDSSVIAEYDGLGGLTAEYVLGDQVDEILTMERGGNAYFYFYSGLGSVSEVTDSTGTVGINAHTHFTYDAFGNLDVVTDANNHATDYDYDELGWLNKVTNPLGFVTKHTFDANGNVIKTERQADALASVWQTTEFTYDILNKLKTNFIP